MRMRALNTGTIKTSATQIWAGPKTESRESVVFFRQRRACEGISASMKKMMLLGALLSCAAAVGHAQESRMDVSASLIGVYAPDVYGQNVFPMHTTNTGGVLASYRYMLTPRSALELNYSWAQNSLNYHAVSAGIPNGRVHARQQELSGAYVYSRTFKNYNPFLEAGVGAMLFTPILDNGTNELSVKSSTQVGGLFGGGLAYEINPSIDVRVEYRGFLMKAPDFGVSAFNSTRYYVLMTPSIGVAYHF
jgi:outer membrane immunogenic protein